MTDEEYHHALYEANSRLIRDYFEKRTNAVLRQASDLYLGRQQGFRGFRQS
jgi:hypothetical protein